jgi:hypothetical protein
MVFQWISSLDGFPSPFLQCLAEKFFTRTFRKKEKPPVWVAPGILKFILTGGSQSLP